MAENPVVTKEATKELKERIVKMHEDIIDLSGGEHGIRDIGGLEHALFEILKAHEKCHEKNPFAAPSKAYTLLATRHYFVDGNKRTSHIFAKTILISMGLLFKPKYAHAVNFIVEISQEKKSSNEIEAWLRKNSKPLESINEYLEDSVMDIRDMKEYMNSHS